MDAHHCLGSDMGSGNLQCPSLSSPSPTSRSKCRSRVLHPITVSCLKEKHAHVVFIPYFKPKQYYPGACIFFGLPLLVWDVTELQQQKHTPKTFLFGKKQGPFEVNMSHSVHSTLGRVAFASWCIGVIALASTQVIYHLHLDARANDPRVSLPCVVP
jgi:hypothetical protein